MEHLTAWRRSSGLTQMRLAGDLGISQATVSKIESGEQRPSLDLALRIARLTRGAVPVESWDAGHDVSHGPASAPDQEACRDG